MGGGSYSTRYPTHIDDLFTETGEYPAIIGAQPDYPDRATFDAMAFDSLVAYSLAGGVIWWSLFPPNPLTGGQADDRSSLPTWSDLYTPGSATYTAWQAKLVDYATMLLAYQNAGVTVQVVRPFLENNADYHWWGMPDNVTNYRLAWNNLVSVFTSYGLSSVLYAYSPNRPYSGIHLPSVEEPDVSKYDILGMDVYADDGSGINYGGAWTWMTGRGKPVGFTEVGAHDGADTNDPDTYNNSTLIASYRSYAPSAAFFMFWNGNYAIINQLGTSDLMGTATVINRADQTWSSGSVAASGTTYYVDATSGDDDNAGTTPATAWQTVAKVNASAFDPDDSVLFKCGEEWREALIVPSSGSSGAPITFGKYGTGALPLFNGCILVAGWAAYSGNVYRSACTQTDHVRMGMFEDDVRLIRVESLGAVVQGSYFLDDANNYLYAWCTDDADPDTHTMEVTVTSRYPIDANEKSWLVFSGLHATKSMQSSFNLRDNACHDIFVTGCYATWSNMRGFDAGIWTGGQTPAGGKYNILVTNSTVHDCISEGFWAGGGTNCGVTWSTIYNGRKDISKGYTISPDVPGIILGQGSDGNYAKYNDVRAEGYETGKPMVMIENESGGVRPVDCIVDSNIIVNDGGNCIHDEATDTLIQNNLVWVVNHLGHLIYSGDGSNGIKIYHNTLVETYSGGYAIYLSVNTYAQVKNNIVYITAGRFTTISAGAVTGFTAANNQYYSTGSNVWSFNGSTHTTLANWVTASGEMGAQQGDPLFVNLGTHDLHLQEGSPCIGYGVAGLTTLDKDGVTRGAAVDVGAYEKV